MSNATPQDAALCDACGQSTRYERVYVTMWLGGELNLIEDVPAHVCDRCGVQYYDAETEERIRQLAVAGFPAFRAKRHTSVPVFGLDADDAETTHDHEKTKGP